MSKMFTATVVSTLLLMGSVLLQSTVLQAIAIGGVKPDLSLIILVFVAIHGGIMVGQVSGFSAGLVQDFISVPPLGFYAFIRTVIGYLYGRLQGSLLGGPVILPLALVAVATIIKGLLSWIVGSVFGMGRGAGIYLGGIMWGELIYNSLLAPLIFAILGRMGLLRGVEKERTR